MGKPHMPLPLLPEVLPADGRGQQRGRCAKGAFDFPYMVPTVMDANYKYVGCPGTISFQSIGYRDAAALIFDRCQALALYQET